MADIAELGLSVRSDGVVVATDRLGKFERQAGGAERATTVLTRSISRLATVAGAALAAAFSVRTLFSYQDALAEVSTLVDTTTFSMSDLSDAALEQGAAFGNVVGQVQAYYQIISAGASSVAEATDILTTSNLLAVGGVTDIATAADGLTSVLNAYGSQVESATAVSDAMFVAMRAGKTTIGELAGSLGRVAPLAAQTGVSFDELTASVAALTKGGISTREAVTGVRAILAAVAKPTSEAAKLAAQLGLEFNSTALRTQGLAGFMETLVEATGGSTDALAQLFGGVEALVPVMALAGQAGEDFNAILDQMADKAGSTQEAFDKMAASPGFQAQRLFSALQVEALKLTNAFGEQLVPAMAFLADNADKLPAILAGIAVAMTVVLAPAIATATASVVAFTASLLTNPIFLYSAALGAIVGAIVEYNRHQALAEQAARDHAEAIVENANAIEIAKTATQGYRDQLQRQIETQIAAAQAALEEARAQAEVIRIKSQAADLFGETMSALSGALFGESRDVSYGSDILTEYGNTLDTLTERVRTLQLQLFKLGEVSSTNPAAIEPTVHSLDDLGLSAETTTDKLSDAEQAAIDLAQTLEQTLGRALASIFRDGSNVLDVFAQLGEQNLASLTTGLFGSTTIGGAANDNAPGIWDGIRQAVQDGAEQGTSDGAFAGLQGFLQRNSGSISAGLGGLGIGFQSQSPILGGIGGALSGLAAGGPIGAIIGGIGGLIGGLLGMNKALEEARKKVDENRTAIEQFIAAGNGTQLSGYARTLADFQKQGSDLIALAEAARDFDLAAQIRAANDNVRNVLAGEYRADIAASLNSLRGNDFLNEVAAAQDKYNERLRDAAALGVSAAGAGEELNLTILKIAKSGDLTENQLRDLAYMFPSLNSAISSIIEQANLANQIADAQDRVTDASNALRQAYEAEKSALEGTISRLEQFRQSIEEFKGSLLFDNNLSPLSPTERLAEAQNLFNAISQAAQGGDATAQGRLQDVARQYLTQARQFYGSGQGYSAIFATVQGALDQAITSAGGQIAGEQNQLEALNRQTSALIDISSNTKSMVDATKDLRDAIAELKVLQAQAAQAQIASTDNVTVAVKLLANQTAQSSSARAA